MNWCGGVFWLYCWSGDDIGYCWFFFIWFVGNLVMFVLKKFVVVMGVGFGIGCVVVFVFV